MKSRFSWLAYFLGVYAALFSLILLACIVFDVGYNTIVPVYFYFIITFFVIFVWIWLVFGELRNKVIVVEIGYDNLIVKRYLGLGSSTVFYFNQIDGFKTSILPASATEYEFLYVMAGEKKIAKLSQFYHKNYADIKQMLISEKVKDLGYEKYNATRELKEIFI
jgi:hypothetical protein